MRRRDWNSKKVLVEEQRYESVSEQCPESEASSLMSSDAENGGPGSVTDSQNLSTFGSSFVKDEDDPFAWVQRLQHVPDKASGPVSYCHPSCSADLLYSRRIKLAGLQDALQELAQLGYSSNDRSGFVNGMQPGRKMKRRGSRS